MRLPEKILTELKNYSGKKLCFMEVCGSHTAAIERSGIKTILSENIRLISGPGCPVCVTPTAYIDRLIDLSCENTICTFGDMIRVPGSRKSLAQVEGRDIRLLYSPLDMLDMAKKEADKNFIFAAVGFETTTPLYALMIETAIKENIKNIRLLTALKTMPQAIRYVTEENDLIDGFIAPGHVCVVTGSDEYKKLAEETGKPFCISGFEPEEILASIYALVKMQGRAEMKNLYPSVVTEEGNLTAQNCVNTYFEPGKAAWRGLGLLEDSGLYLKKEYSAFDAGSRALTEDRKKNPLCRCGDILKGFAEPCDCPMFGTKCTPQEPQGACMVSYEGACAQAYES